MKRECWNHSRLSILAGLFGFSPVQKFVSMSLLKQRTLGLHHLEVKMLFIIVTGQQNFPVIYLLKTIVIPC